MPLTMRKVRLRLWNEVVNVALTSQQRINYETLCSKSLASKDG
jgi:hypothetical protein